MGIESRMRVCLVKRLVQRRCRKHSRNRQLKAAKEMSQSYSYTSLTDSDNSDYECRDGASTSLTKLQLRLHYVKIAGYSAGNKLNRVVIFCSKHYIVHDFDATVKRPDNVFANCSYRRIISNLVYMLALHLLGLLHYILL